MARVGLRAERGSPVGTVLRASADAVWQEPHLREWHRAREGLPPTRFPRPRTLVHHQPPPFLTGANVSPTYGAERLPTRVNETRTETRSPPTTGSRSGWACPESASFWSPIRLGVFARARSWPHHRRSAWMRCGPQRHGEAASSRRCSAGLRTHRRLDWRPQSGV